MKKILTFCLFAVICFGMANAVQDEPKTIPSSDDVQETPDIDEDVVQDDLNAVSGGSDDIEGVCGCGCGDKK